jgi:uncharacterized protein (TIGR02646 family)
MRPVRKGLSPRQTDFSDYADAKPELIARLGHYCSYCERRIATNLAVEHIQPKDGPHGHPGLIGTWTNFLLACVNCNSAKGRKEVVLADLLFPDRDNTFASYEYTPDGKVKVSSGITPAQAIMAGATLKLVGLDKYPQKIVDSNGDPVAIDRVAQRMECWAIALESLQDFIQAPAAAKQVLIRAVVRTAVASGAFSIWMTVFHAYSDVRIELIRAFDGTQDSGCFDMNTANSVTPSPNVDNLPYGGKC